jgi:hypothetical protein
MPSPVAAVYADADARVFDNLDDADAGKLGSLIGVEDFWLAITAYGFLEGLNAKIRPRVLDRRQERTLRPRRSMTATSYINPRDMVT